MYQSVRFQKVTAVGFDVFSLHVDQILILKSSQMCIDTEEKGIFFTVDHVRQLHVVTVSQ